MTWTLIAVLIVGTYLIRVSGFTLLVNRDLPDLVMRLLAYVPAALLASLIAVQTVSTEGAYAIDARLVGVASAGVAVALKAPFAVVFLVGVGVTALVRLVL